MTGIPNLTSNDGTLYRKLAEMTDRGEQGVLVTVIETKLSTPRHAGSKMIVQADGSITGSIGGGACEVRAIEESALVISDLQCRRLEMNLAGDLGVCGGRMEVFLEPVVRTVPFVIIGAGHVGRAMLEVGRSLPFRFIVVDDRPGLLSDLVDLPQVTIIQAGPDELAEKLPANNFSAVLLASRSHSLDSDYLAAVMDSEFKAGVEYPFLGVLGSQTKSKKIRQRFLEDSGTAERIGRVQMPVGLDIGAETPAEIALSVYAEAMAVLRNTGSLKDEHGVPCGIQLHRNRKIVKDSSKNGAAEK